MNCWTNRTEEEYSIVLSSLTHDTLNNEDSEAKEFVKQAN
jgi:hypothetical protein